MSDCEICELWYCGTDQPPTKVKRINENDKNSFYLCPRCIRAMKKVGTMCVYESWQWQNNKKKAAIHFIFTKKDGFEEVFPEIRPQLGLSEMI